MHVRLAMSDNYLLTCLMAARRVMGGAWSPQNPWIFTAKQAFMQRLSDRVRLGATHYVSGITKLEAIPALCKKFSERYPLNLSAQQSSRRFKDGHSIYYWSGYFDSTNRLVHWVLLLKLGKQSDHSDRWRSVIESRINLTNYELLRHTRSGTKNPAWTWRYERAKYQELRGQVISSVRAKRDLETKQLMAMIFASPGFAGIREQIKSLKALFIAEWKRSRRKDETPIELPPTIFYVRRTADKGEYYLNLCKAHALPPVEPTDARLPPSKSIEVELMKKLRSLSPQQQSKLFEMLKESGRTGGPVV